MPERMRTEMLDQAEGMFREREATLANACLILRERHRAGYLVCCLLGLVFKQSAGGATFAALTQAYLCGCYGISCHRTTLARTIDKAVGYGVLESARRGDVFELRIRWDGVMAIVTGRAGGTATSSVPRTNVVHGAPMWCTVHTPRAPCTTSASAPFSSSPREEPRARATALTCLDLTCLHDVVVKSINEGGRTPDAGIESNGPTARARVSAVLPETLRNQAAAARMSAADLERATAVYRRLDWSRPTEREREMILSAALLSRTVLSPEWLDAAVASTIRSARVRGPFLRAALANGLAETEGLCAAAECRALMGVLNASVRAEVRLHIARTRPLEVRS